MDLVGGGDDLKVMLWHNLGEIYRNQFESAARRYEGDLDQVIANWTVEELDT